jgi:hypothetical protein
LIGLPRSRLRCWAVWSNLETGMRRRKDIRMFASMNILLDDPGVVKAASRLIRSKTEELRDLYQADAAPPK